VTPSRATAEVLAAVTPRALHAYLAAQGWRKVRVIGDKGDLYAQEGTPEILAPASDHFADYSVAMSQIVDILARTEDRDAQAVLRDLTIADVDLIRVRAHEAEEDGSISIARGVDLVQQSHDMLLAAACAAAQPKRAYRAGSNKEASDYMSTVRIGQTERGSFVLTLVSPVAPSLVANDQQPTLWPEVEAEPFARKVTRQLIKALESAREAVALANRGAGIDAFEQRVASGISANLCAAVANLAKDGNGLDVSVAWALTRLTPLRQSRVDFTRADADILSEAATVLRDREPRPGERIEGQVTHLARGPDATDGQVTIKAAIDGRMSSIRADFGPDLYRQVADAHRDRLSVALEGDLQREGQRWRLVNPRDLGVLPDDGGVEAIATEEPVQLPKR
jgi:hypothetical protein